MDFLRYFFRSQEDGYIFRQYGGYHIILLLIYILGMALIITKSFGIEEKNKNDKFLKLLAAILLLDQIILYAWQFASGYFRMDMSLPLYHCRLAVWLLIAGIFTDDRLVKILGAYMGFMGSSIAMIIPDLYNFSFPHYTNIQFFLVHILMGWVVVDFIFVEKLFVKKEELKKVLFITNSFNVFLLAFNMYLRPTFNEVNYGYILSPPANLPVEVPGYLYVVIVFILFNFIVLLLYRFFNSMSRRVVSE